MDLPRYKLFTSLPTCISGCVMGEWLTLDSVVRLDTAFCHRMLRRELFEHYRPNGLVVKSEIHLSLEVLQWLETRGLKTAHLVIEHPFRKKEDSEQLSAYVEICAPVLRNVKCGKHRLPRAIAKFCCSLTNLSIGLAEDMDNELKALRNNSDLRELSITSDATSGAAHKNKRVFKGIVLPALEVLTLTVLSYFPRAFESAAGINKNLARLDLQSNRLQSHDALEHFSNLRALRVARLVLSNDTWSIIGSRNPLIEHLELRSPSGFDDASVLRMVQHLGHLRSISFDGSCDSRTIITDLTLQHLADYCADTLEVVHLQSWYFTTAAVSVFRQRCRKLVSFHATYDNDRMLKRFPAQSSAVTAFELNSNDPKLIDLICERLPLLEVLDLRDISTPGPFLPSQPALPRGPVRFVTFLPSSSKNCYSKYHDQPNRVDESDRDSGELLEHHYISQVVTKCPHLHTLVVRKTQLSQYAWVRSVFPRVKVVTEGVLDFSNALQLPLSC